MSRSVTGPMAQTSERADVSARDSDVEGHRSGPLSNLMLMTPSSAAARMLLALPRATEYTVCRHVDGQGGVRLSAWGMQPGPTPAKSGHCRLETATQAGALLALDRTSLLG